MYIVQEIQSFADGTVRMLTPVLTEDPQQAESVFHQQLAAAAVSELPVHAVALLDETGALRRREFYTHVPVAVTEA